MTVQELINKLLEAPPEALVLSLNYNDAGLDDVERAVMTNVDFYRPNSIELGRYIETPKGTISAFVISSTGGDYV